MNPDNLQLTQFAEPDQGPAVVSVRLPLLAGPAQGPAALVSVTPAAPSVGAAPASPATGTASPTRWAILRELTGLAITRGAVLGLRCGVVYGALWGLFVGLMLAGLTSGASVLIALPLGALIGVTVGAVSGALLGLIQGPILALISMRWFSPLLSSYPYRGVMATVSVLLTVLLMLGSTALLGGLNPLGPSFVLVFALVLIPLLIGCGCACLASDALAERYAEIAPALSCPNLYEPSVQDQLSDQLQRSSRRVAWLAGLGQPDRWRSRLIDLMSLAPDARVCDLMAGTGELWPHLLPQLGPEGRVIAIERRPGARGPAQAWLARRSETRVELRQGDALSTGLPDGSVSAVTCSFGATLLDQNQAPALVDEIARILDTNGVVGLLDQSLPERRLVRWAYRGYLGWFVPLVALLVGGKPYPYCALAHFVEQACTAQQLEHLLIQRGFQIYRYRLSGGAATALVGMKLWTPHNH